MKRRVDKKHNYSNMTQRSFVGLVVLLFVCIVVTGSTLAYFFSDDYATNLIGLSGKVDIEVVSKSPTYRSIEDTADETKLIIYFEDNYSVLLPGAYIEPTANIKVFQSTTKPLLRAKMSVALIDMSTKEEITDESIDKFDLAGSLYDSMSTIASNNGWVFYENDEYFYYCDTNTVAANVGDTFLKEVDVTENNVIINFINGEFQFPPPIDSDYSGYGVKFVITFEAIQDFIPDIKGNKLENTIENSKLIFDNPNANPYD